VSNPLNEAKSTSAATAGCLLTLRCAESGFGRTAGKSSLGRRDGEKSTCAAFRLMGDELDGIQLRARGWQREDGEWQRMVLLETRGLWLSWIVREGIG
jgi:hypothetical protein